MFVNLIMEMEAWNILQRYVCYLLCVKLGDSATTTHGKLQQAFGDHAISRAQAFCGNKILFKGRTLVEDEHAADNHQQNGEVKTLHG